LRAEKLESLGTLAGGIAHDFNNALAAITGSLFLAADRVKHDRETHELVLGAMDAAFRSTTLTKQLLTFAKGGAPVKRCVDSGALVRRAVEFCLHGSSASWALTVSPDVSPIEVDEGQFEQALSNLVINAKQAMPDGGQIDVWTEDVFATDPHHADAKERRYVRVSVRDAGVGISADDQRRMFEPYFSTKQSGTGLGLTTAYSVIRKHGGFMLCESALGQGSTFSIYLPASDKTPEEKDTPPPPKTMTPGRVLVMDDDVNLLDLTQRLLRDAGYDTVGVASGTAALQAYAEARAAGRGFDVTLLDLTVPGGDGGKETISKLLDLDPDAKAVVVSGYSDDPVLARYREYGFAGGLAKPYKTKDLLRVVEAVTNA
jgi:CheY-like chemotaxis protein